MSNVPPPLLAVLLVITAEFMFASVGAVVRHLSADLSNAMLVFFRNLAGLVLLSPLLLRRHRLQLRTSVPHLHLLRGLSGLTAMYCFFYAIANMPLANAMLLKLSAPLFIPLVAAAWLHEALSTRVLLAVLVGFVGVGIILAPNLETLAPVAAVALLGGLFAGIAKVIVRRLGHSEPPTRTVFYFALLGSLVSLLPLPWFWTTPSGGQWAWLAVIGLLATLGQLALTRGFAMAEAGRVGVFAYFSVLFAAFWGWYLWGEPITPSMLAGSALVMVAGVLAASWQRRARDTRHFVKQATENDPQAL